jgi:hypothetical protein
MPLVDTMLSTVRSNKSAMLDKSKHFRKTTGSKSKKTKTEYDFPESSPEVLSNIREKLKLQNEKTRTKQFIIFMVLVVVIIISVIEF